VTAVFLAAILPERKAEIWDRAQDYAESRVILGMHYPSDLEMGYRSGTALAAALLEDAEFQADLAAARTEARAALGLK
jgi:acid phosphatase (class A)